MVTSQRLRDHLRSDPVNKTEQAMNIDYKVIFFTHARISHEFMEHTVK